MRLCSGDRKNRHEEICFESGDCPFCNYIDEKDDELNSASEKIAELEKIIVDLEGK